MRKQVFILKPQLFMGAGIAGFLIVAQTAPSLTAADKKVAQQVKRVLHNRISSPNKSLQLVVQPTIRSRDGYFAEIIVAGKPVQIKKLRVSEFDLRAKD